MKKIKYPSIKGKYRKRVFDYKKITKQKEITEEDRKLLKTYTPKALKEKKEQEDLMNWVIKNHLWDVVDLIRKYDDKNFLKDKAITPSMFLYEETENGPRINVDTGKENITIDEIKKIMNIFFLKTYFDSLETEMEVEEVD